MIGCSRCKSSELHTKTLCFSCSEMIRLRNKKKRDYARVNGICTSCFKRPFEENRTRCGKCLKANLRYINRKMKEGFCSCGTKTLDGNKYKCEKCWYKTVAYNTLNDRSRWEEIKGLMESQGYICAITGDTLIPGVNASLDHKMPKSRGGTHEISNIEWILTEANYFKYTRTKKELLELCKKILAHCEE